MNLFKSRTFITCLLDALAKAAALIASKYATPETAAMLHDLWLTFQPVILFLVAYFTVNDFAAPAVTRAVTRAVSRELTSRGIGSVSYTPPAANWRGAIEYQQPRIIGNEAIAVPVVGEIGATSESKP